MTSSPIRINPESNLSVIKTQKAIIESEINEMEVGAGAQ